MKAAFLGLATALALAGGGAEAHHSAAMFDRAKVVVLQGVVKTYAYTQPHSWIDVIVPGEGGSAAVEWGVECGAPPAMRGQGITPSVVKAGDKITIRIHPLKDGRPAGSFIDLIVNGRAYGDGHGPTGEPTPAN